jgi:hypothetical protein
MSAPTEPDPANGDPVSGWVGVVDAAVARPVTPVVTLDRRRPRRLGVLAIGAGACVVLLAALGAVLAGGGSGHPAQAPTATAPDAVTFHDPGGQFTLSVPGTWLVVSTRTDASTIGTETFPRDPIAATAIQRAADALPRSAVLLGFIRADMGSGHFATNLNLIKYSGYEFRVVVPAMRSQIAQFGGKVASITNMTIGGRAAARVNYRLATGIDGAMYVVDGGSTVWELTFSTTQLLDPARFDPIASTLRLTPTTSL